MRAGRRWVLVLAVVGTVMGLGAAAWACVPGSQLWAQPDFGAPGQNATVHGEGFPERPVQIHWGSSTGPVIATGQGSEFAVEFSVPDVRDGVYTIVAVAQPEESADGEAKSPPYSRTTRAPFEVAADGSRGSWGDGAWEQGLPDNADAPEPGSDDGAAPDATSGPQPDEAAQPAPDEAAQPAPDGAAQPAPRDTVGQPGPDQPGRQHVGPAPTPPRSHVGPPAGQAPAEPPPPSTGPAPPSAAQPPSPAPPEPGGGAPGPSGGSAAAEDGAGSPSADPSADPGTEPDERAATDDSGGPGPQRATSAEALRRKLEARLDAEAAPAETSSPDDTPASGTRQHGAEQAPGLLSGGTAWALAFVVVLLALATAFAGFVYRQRPQLARRHAGRPTGRRPTGRTKLFSLLLLVLAAALTLPGSTSSEGPATSEEVTARDDHGGPGSAE